MEFAARGIRTNALLPGVVRTPLIARLAEDPNFASFMEYLKGRHPIGRFADPPEIGAAAMWLLSDSASFVNGAAIVVDGGFHAAIFPGASRLSRSRERFRLCDMAETSVAKLGIPMS